MGFVKVQNNEALKNGFELIKPVIEFQISSYLINGNLLRQMDLVSKYNSKREEYYYICYHDGKTFENERKYVAHFNKFHYNDFPFYCDICERGFYSYSAITEHNRAKKH